MTNALTQDAATISHIVTLTTMHDWSQARALVTQIVDPERRAQILPLLEVPPLTVTAESPIGQARAKVTAAQVRYDHAVAQLRDTETSIQTATRRLDLLQQQPVGDSVDVSVEAEISATRRRIEQLEAKKAEQAIDVAECRRPFEYANESLQVVERGYWHLAAGLQKLQLDHAERVATIESQLQQLTGNGE